MIQILRYLLTHPLSSRNKLAALSRFFKWQFGSRLVPYPVVYPFTEHSKLLVWRGLAGATSNMYCGLHEFFDMGFVLHFLRPDDLFVDIGANIGSYTMLASAEAGAYSISVEPIPTTFEYLTNNILINRITNRVEVLNLGLGSEKGVIKFTRSFDSENHVATPDESDTVDVPVNTLDNILGNRLPVLIKIDVEGFETEVLKGAGQTLKNPTLKAVIIELNGSGNRYGYDEQAIHQNFLQHGFQACQYDPFTRNLKPAESFGDHNTIYIRDLDFTTERVRSARKIKINSSVSL